MAIHGFLAGHAMAQSVTQKAPPPGFEDLLEAQEALIDIVYEGDLVGSFMATFEPGLLRFADPSAVVDALPGVTNREEVAAALSGELRTNADKLCGPNPFAGCGVLEPEVAGVIFDEARFQATVFIAGAYQERATLAYLPPPDLRPGFVNAFAGAIAGSRGEGEPRTTLRSLSLLSVGAARVRSELSWGLQEGSAFDELKSEYDRGRWRGEGGFYRMAPLTLLGDRPFLGIGVGTTLDTLQDAEQLLGSSLTLFLPERSQVEIYRDGRLLSARTYDAGTNDLYTADLPEGAYFVTLRIVGPSGIQEETRFFTKSLEIPPLGQPVWRLQAGVLADDEPSLAPSPGDTPFLHGATRHRITDALAIGADATLAQGQYGVGADIAVLMPQAKVQAEGFATNQDAHGLGLSVQGNVYAIGYTANFRRIWASDRPYGRGRRSDGDLSFARRDPNRLFDVGGTATQASFRLNYSVPRGPLLGFRASYTARRSQASHSFGPSLSWPLLSSGSFRLHLHGDATVTDKDRLLFVQLRLSWGRDGLSLVNEAGWRGSLGGERGPGQGPFGRSSAAWNALDEQGQRLDLRASATADQQGNTLGGGLNYRGPRGRADATLERDNLNQGRYSANVFANLVGDLDGFAVGGPEIRESAVVVSLAGAPDTRFRVLVNERPRGEVAGNGSLVVPLDSYKTYDIRIMQTEGRFLGYEASARSVTLYPGNVRTLQWTLAPVVLIYGQVLQPDGSPLPDARVSDVRPAALTDSEGWFQLEVNTNESSLVLSQPKGGQCHVALPPLPQDRDYYNVGQLICLSEGGD